MISSPTEFVAPNTIDEAVGVLGEKGDAACVLAGGTDVMVRIRRGTLPGECTTLVSLHRIASMRGCRRDGDRLLLGAATTATDLMRDPLVAECVPILGQVANRLASAQIRNVATVGGNLVNASPAGDLIIPLLLLDAELVLVSGAGTRRVPVKDFFTAPGKTVLKRGELLVEARFDAPPAERMFGFEKAGTRPSMECSVVTVGVARTPRDGKMTSVRVAFGSSAPTPLRGMETEAVLEGQALTPDLARRAAEVAEREVRPISDVRGSECYRRALVGVFLRRLLDG